MSGELRYERVIEAPLAVVFDAFTTAGGQQAFYGQDDSGWIVDSVCDLRVGGVRAVAFGPSRTHLYRHRHVFGTIDRPRRLILTTTEVRVDGTRLDFAIEFTFTGRDGGTLMTMVQTGFRSDELRDEHARGLPDAVDRFQRFALTPAPAQW